MCFTGNGFTPVIPLCTWTALRDFQLENFAAVCAFSLGPGEIELSLEAGKRAFELAPDNATCRCNLAIYQYTAGDALGAHATFVHVEKEHPTHEFPPPVLRVRAMSYFKAFKRGVETDQRRVLELLEGDGPLKTAFNISKADIARAIDSMLQLQAADGGDAGKNDLPAILDS